MTNLFFSGIYFFYFYDLTQMYHQKSGIYETNSFFFLTIYKKKKKHCIFVK